MDVDIQKYVTHAYDVGATFAPKLLAALVILIVAYIVGKLLGRAVGFLIGKTSLADGNTVEGKSTIANIAKAVFWVVMLIALPAILGALGMQSIVKPLQEMAEKFLAFIPNLFGAGLIFFIGLIVATVVRNAIESVATASKLDDWAEAYGMGGNGNISRSLAYLAFGIVIIPVAVAALDALQITAISAPAKQMLTSVMDAIPNVFAASVVLLIAYFISKFASTMISSLLSATNVDQVAGNTMLGDFIGRDRSVSDLAAKLAGIAILLFGLIEAAKLLNFAIISEVLSHVMGLGGNILLGSAIILFGVFAAGIVSNVVAGASGKGSPVPGLVKTIVIILVAAMGLKQMGVADEIVTLGFTMMIGAIAVGTAIAIGFGGQEAAKRLTNKWTKNI